MSSGSPAIRYRRQLFNIQRDRPDPVLGECGAVGQDDRDGLTDIAHAVDRDNRLQKPLGSGQGQKAQWDRRDRPDLSCRDDSAHAGDGVRSGCVDSAKAAMRARAAQDRGMQHALAPQIADKFAAAAQKAQILDSLDRAADVTVGPNHGLSVFR